MNSQEAMQVVQSAKQEGKRLCATFVSGATPFYSFGYLDDHSQFCTQRYLGEAMAQMHQDGLILMAEADSSGLIGLTILGEPMPKVEAASGVRPSKPAVKPRSKASRPRKSRA